MSAISGWLLRTLSGWHAALMFYTCLPVPSHWPLEFRWIAYWVPWVGCLVGGLLAIADGLLTVFQVPVGVASALVIALGIGLTGGLHLDGVMDAADGLAVPDPNRRLMVMRDSHTGAFGGMAVVVVLLLKVLALAAIAKYRWFVLIAVAMWGRWAQQWAIACYPYLRKDGKGAFHKAALPKPVYALPSLLGLVGLSGLLWVSGSVPAEVVIRSTVGGIVFTLATNAYFYRHLRGHTGDTYGAVVEWTEALLLCSLSVL